jgi:hypothetical protein
VVDEQAVRGLKTAFRGLVERAGGFDPAAAYLGFSGGHLNEAMSPHRPDRAPRVDHVARLEAHVGEPLVTAQLARLAGYTLVPAGCAPGVPAERLARVLRASGEVGGIHAEALADGALDEAERLALTEALDVLIRSAQQARATLAGPRLSLVSSGVKAAW